jgi:hypothetical protein
VPSSGSQSPRLRPPRERRPARHPGGGLGERQRDLASNRAEAAPGRRSRLWPRADQRHRSPQRRIANPSRIPASPTTTPPRSLGGVVGEPCQWTRSLTRLLNPNSYELPGRSQVIVVSP